MVEQNENVGKKVYDSSLGLIQKGQETLQIGENFWNLSSGVATGGESKAGVSVEFDDGNGRLEGNVRRISVDSHGVVAEAKVTSYHPQAQRHADYLGTREGDEYGGNPCVVTPPEVSDLTEQEREELLCMLSEALMSNQSE